MGSEMCIRDSNLALKVSWDRWDTCSLCEQLYHGVVRCALGWGCWKTYLCRPETDEVRCNAMTQLGNGLADAEHHEDALSVQEAELAMMRRIDAPEGIILDVLSNLANTYDSLGRSEEALLLKRDVYSTTLKLHGEEHEDTLLEANNYAASLRDLRRFEEAKSVLRKTMPMARRVFGNCNDTTLKMRKIYACALFEDPTATLNDFREGVATFEDTERTARRVLGLSLIHI